MTSKRSGKNFLTDMTRAWAPYPRAHEPWTSEEDARLVDLYRRGRDIEDLADEFQRRPATVEARLKHLALELLRVTARPSIPRLRRRRYRRGL